MGTTHDARQGMRIRYVEPAAVTGIAPAGVTVLDRSRNL